MRVHRLTALIVCLAATLAAAGCGGDEAESVLSETASKLGKIRSGELTLSVIAEGGESRAGFQLAGPFALPEEGRLPVAELSYTQIAGGREETVTLISSGDEAFVEVDGRAYVLPDEQADRLRAAGASLGGSAAGSGSGGSTESGGQGLGALGIDGWLVNPEVSDGDEVGGAETERISAKLDVVRAANDLLALLAAFGGGQAARIQGRDAENVRRATEKATVEILTGKDDRLLRSLVVDLRLSADAPKDLRDQLGPLGRAHFRLELAIAKPNEPVSVQAPANAEPFPGGSL